MCSGITSASTASKFFAENLVVGLHQDWDTTVVTCLALGFMLLLAVINLRGVGESVKFNVVLTLVELVGPAARDRDRLLRLRSGQHRLR